MSSGGRGLYRAASMVGAIDAETFLLPDEYKFVSNRMLTNGHHERLTFQTSVVQKIFIYLDKPDSCLLAKGLSLFTMTVILLSCITFVMSSEPSMMSRPETCPHPACKNDPVLCPGREICEPEPFDVFTTIEMVCVSFFCLDYGLRMFTVAFVPAVVAKIKLPSSTDNDPVPLTYIYPWNVQLWRYGTQYMNIIDLMAILPFFISFAANAGESVSIIRILRLARILRIFRMKNLKKFLLLITTAVVSSLTALALLLFFAVLIVVIFAAIEFIIERGDFTVNADYPDGAYLRWNVNGEEKEVSPFNSVLTACYWAAVTSTTVGYGDMVPTSPAGRVMAAVLMYTGILFIALPVGVLGSAFNEKYQQFIPHRGMNEEDLDLDGVVMSVPSAESMDSNLNRRANKAAMSKGRQSRSPGVSPEGPQRQESGAPDSGAAAESDLAQAIARAEAAAALSSTIDATRISGRADIDELKVAVRALSNVAAAASSLAMVLHGRLGQLEQQNTTSDESQQFLSGDHVEMPIVNRSGTSTATSTS